MTNTTTPSTPSESSNWWIIIDGLILQKAGILSISIKQEAKGESTRECYANHYIEIRYAGGARPLRVLEGLGSSTAQKMFDQIRAQLV